MKAIYLHKPRETESSTDAWVYYRVGSISAAEVGGTLGAPLQVCRVSWPTFEDLPPATDTPGLTGLVAAHPNVCRLLEHLLGVDHERSELIGFLE